MDKTKKQNKTGVYKFNIFKGVIIIINKAVKCGINN